MRTLILLWTALLLTSCSGDDQYFWTKLKVMPPETTSAGTQTGVEAELHVGQYSRRADITQKYRGQIKGSIVSLWKVSRLKGGKPKTIEICGKEPKKLRRWSQEEWRAEGADERRERESIV